jgi:hypothetical protein
MQEMNILTSYTIKRQAVIVKSRNKKYSWDLIKKYSWEKLIIAQKPTWKIASYLRGNPYFIIVIILIYKKTKRGNCMHCINSKEVTCV